MMTELKLTPEFDGEVIVSRPCGRPVTVLVHNAICQDRDHNRKRLPAQIVAEAQAEVDAAYRIANDC